jgi:hypothetical protein
MSSPSTPEDPLEVSHCGFGLNCAAMRLRAFGPRTVVRAGVVAIRRDPPRTDPAITGWRIQRRFDDALASAAVLTRGTDDFLQPRHTAPRRSAPNRLLAIRTRDSAPLRSQAATRDLKPSLGTHSRVLCLEAQHVEAHADEKLAHYRVRGLDERANPQPRPSASVPSGPGYPIPAISSAILPLPTSHIDYMPTMTMLR